MTDADPRPSVVSTGCPDVEERQCEGTWGRGGRVDDRQQPSTTAHPRPVSMSQRGVAVLWKSCSHVRRLMKYINCFLVILRETINLCLLKFGAFLC